MRLYLRLLVALLAGAEGARKVRRSGGEPGQVHGLFPFASPGVSILPLENLRGGESGTCFPGYRSWTMRRRWWGTEADLTTTIAGVFGFRHPVIATHELDLTEGEEQLRETPCDDPDIPNIPRGTPVILHHQDIYANASQGYSELLYNMSNVGLRNSLIRDVAVVTKNVTALGWEVLGVALDEGGGVGVSGEQVSWLFQQPESKACILTFEGTGSINDWMANANIRRVPFCGLTAQGGKEVLVHKGFRDSYRAMVQDADWQTNIKPKLSACSRLYVTGHSQGGAEGELFTACAQHAPQPGEDGYEEDYKHIEWQV